MKATAPAVPMDLLKRVSRSFYISLWLLPAAVRAQISLAYLLARATDTIADTELVPVGERLNALELLRARMLGNRTRPVAFAALADHQGQPAERELLQQVEAVTAALDGCEPDDQRLIRQVLDTITSGQMLDLQRFGAVTPGQVAALATPAELTDYTYRVAGCVGEFWTRICVAHLRPAPGEPVEALVVKGVLFGQGLQLVNILRDLPRDLRQGRCYLPLEELRAAALQPADLLAPGNELRLRPVYDRWVEQAMRNLRAGWEYTLALPFSWWRVRWACALPILIGIKTLVKLRANPVLRPELRIKVTRAELRGIVWRMVFWYPWPRQWRQLPQQRNIQSGNASVMGESITKRGRDNSRAL